MTRATLFDRLLSKLDHPTRMRQKNLLTQIQSSTLSMLDIETEKKKAFDLWMPLVAVEHCRIVCAELHVVAVPHCFDNDMMGTIIQDKYH
jgi:hypothetical protein